MLGSALYAVTAAHSHDAVGLCGNQGLHLCLNTQAHAAVVCDGSADDGLAGSFQGCLQLSNLGFATGLAGSSTAATAEDRYGLGVANQGHNFFNGFLLCNDH
jgi:hypothetical protein